MSRLTEDEPCHFTKDDLDVILNAFKKIENEWNELNISEDKVLEKIHDCRDRMTRRDQPRRHYRLWYTGMFEHFPEVDASSLEEAQAIVRNQHLVPADAEFRADVS